MTRILGLAAVVIASVTLSACGMAQSEFVPEPKSAFSITDSVEWLETASGTFEGASGHMTSGTVSIFRVDGQWVVSLGNDFSFDGAPDPHVALGHNGYRAEATLDELASNQGAQSYTIPANLDVADFDEVWIWCERFSVPLGSAKLTLL